MKKRCKKCGQLVYDSSAHHCVTVTTRKCLVCDKTLDIKKSGFGRYCKYCKVCWSKRNCQFRKERRDKLRMKFGGKCSKCGYNKCLSALQFHHDDSSGKKDYNNNGDWRASIKEIKEHPERFSLLCANCHIEFHDKEGALQSK